MPDASSTTPIRAPAMPTPRADWRSTAMPAARAEVPATAARPITAYMSFFMCMCLSWCPGSERCGAADEVGDLGLRGGRIRPDEQEPVIGRRRPLLGPEPRDC